MSIDRSTGSYVYQFKDDNGKWKKKTFGKDLAVAVNRYKEYRGWESNNFRIKNPDPNRKGLGIDAEVEIKKEALLSEHGEHILDVIEGIQVNEVGMPEELFWERVRTEILNNPKRAAQMTEIEELGYLNKLKKPTTLKIDTIVDNYVNRVEVENPTPSQKQDKKKIQHTWDKVKQITKVTRANDLDSKDLLKKLYDNLYSEYHSNDLSTTWLKGHIERIIRVLNWNILNTDDSDILTAIKEKCSKVLKTPKQVVKNPPKQISKAHFKRILKVSSVEEMAMWLLSMQGGYYTVDIATLPKSAINLREGIIVYRRTKTNEPRSMILGKAVIVAVRDYQKEYPHDCDTLFMNTQDKTPYNKDRIGVKFRKCLEKAGLKGEYGHNNFRDSATSVCLKSKVYEPSIDALLGHKISGEKKKYIDPEENPHIAKEASKAVADYYFSRK